jgi:UDP-N-acetylmuramoylalanine--D-glutamate ligase
MIPVTPFAAKKVAVFGLGASGLSTCRALIAGGADIVAFDDDLKKIKEADQAGIPTTNLCKLDWAMFAALVLSPGVPLTHPAPHWTVGLAGKAGVEVIGDVELFNRTRARDAPDAPFIGITGTNGKSTTTALIAHLLRTAGHDVQVGGNLGTPILDLEPPARNRYHVIELSSFQIDLAPTLAPSVGVLLNVTPDHLDRHGTLDNYAAIKERLIIHADVAVVAVDDDFTRAVAARRDGTKRPIVRVSAADRLAGGFFVDGSAIVQAEGKEAPVIADLAGIATLRGRHNAQNAAAAIAAALALEIPIEAIRRGLVTFPGLAHRLEEIGRVGRVLFINDSKATNADSADKALASFPGDIFWILGGKAKEGGIASLTGFFPKVAKAYLIGEATEDFARTLDGKVAYEKCGTLDRAVELAARDASASAAPQPVVLLSPACASYDQYPNFEVRGDRFRTLVRALPGITAA